MSKFLFFSLLLFSFYSIAEAQSPIELQEVLVTDDTSDFVEEKLGNDNDVGSLIMQHSSVVSPVLQEGTYYATPLFIRGLDSKHTTVTLDGMVLKDPAATDTQVNLSKLSSTDVTSANILLGSEAAFNFSGAVAGVVSLQTPMDVKKHIGVGYGVEKSLSLAHQWNSSLTKVLFFGSLTQSSEQIQSHAKTGQEKDHFSNQGASFKVIHAPATDIVTETFVKVNRYDIDLDPAPFTDGKKDRSISENSIINHKTTWSEDDFNYLVHRLSYLKIDRLQETAFGDYHFDSNNFQQQATFVYGREYQHWVGDLYYEHNQFSTDEVTSASAALYDLNVTGNFRLENNFYKIKTSLISHTEFDQRGLLALQYVRKLTKTTSFIAGSAMSYNPPSLYQLYGPATTGNFACEVGNNELAPEIGENFEAGFQVKKEQSFAQVKVFSQKVKDYINYNCEAGYQNELELLSHGVELEWRVGHKKHTVGIGASYMDFELSSEEKLLRRPREKFIGSYAYQATNHHQLWGQYNWIGKRYDTNNFEVVKVPAVSVLDVGWSYLQDHHVLVAEIGNIFNEDDSLNYGFSGRRRIYSIHYKYLY